MRYLLFLMICYTLSVEAEQNPLTNHVNWINSVGDSIRIIKDREFGTSDEIVIGKFSSFVVDIQNRVYIADRDLTTIVVFDEDAKFLTTIGRQGKGPAEFSAISPITEIKVQQNLLYVPDYSDPGAFFPNRMQIFSTEDFSFVKTVQLIPHNRKEYEKFLKGYFPQVVYPINSEAYIVDFRRGRQIYKDSASFIRYFVIGQNSKIVEGPIMELQDVVNLGKVVVDGEWSILHLRTFPFFEKSLFEISENGNIYSARTGDFKIQVRNLKGKVMRTIQQPYDKLELSRRKLLDSYEKAGNKVHVDMIKEAKDLPKYWPALNHIFLDDQNRLWVQTFTDRESEFKWFVLSESGEILATFMWPADKEIKSVRNQNMYTLETDSDGFSIVVRYQIKGLES